MNASAIEAKTDEIEAVDILEASDVDVAGTLRVPAIGDLLDDTLARANMTQEIRVEDILEASDLRTPLTWETPPDAFYHPGGRVRTIGEMTIERAPPPEPTIIGRLRERRKRFGLIVAAILVIPVGILAGAGIVALASPGPAATTAAPTHAPAPATEKQATEKPEDKTVEAPAPMVEAKPTSGTILGPAKKALFLDGKKLGSSSAIVACGKHKVKVGWGRTQTVDVPCGGELKVK